MKDPKSFLLKKIKFLLEQEEKAKESGPNTPESPLLLRDPKARARPAADSVDDQIDALLLRYESASIRKGDSINESLKKLNLRFLLEQDEEPADEEPVEEPADAEPAEEPTDEEPADESEEPDPSGSDDMSVTSPAPRQKVPDLDIDKFTSRVVRLMNNYESLLNIEESIINRAKSFLDENYGEAFVYEFVNNLSNQYGLETSEFGNIPAISDDKFAVGAFAGGTGGLGGGGGG
jgi:hypothetical protein